MAPESDPLIASIAALEAQRAALGDAVVDAAIAVLRAGSGAAAGAASPPAQSLRQVTILFLDVVGSTVLSRQLDPEGVQAVMDGALARCTAIVETHRGRVLQYAGDNLLAVFGAEAAREDDAERAVRCGLALLAEGRALGAEVLARHGHAGFDVRVGAHTGEVLLGGGVDPTGSIRGIAVNVAARMEQTAPPGGLRISRDTFGHVRGRFELEPQPPIDVKGIDGPVATWLVRGERPVGFRGVARGVEGVATRMIGRDRELALLQHAWQAIVGGGAGLRSITLVGEAGVGKSRLLHEFDAWSKAHTVPARVLCGRAVPDTQGQPYGLLRDIVAARLGIADGDSVQAARDKVESGIVPLFAGDDGAELAQAQAHLLGHLVGIDFADSPHLRGIRDDARQIRERGLHAAMQIFRRLARAPGEGGAVLPLMLQLEDLHWADDASLDFIEQLARVGRELPLLIVALARPVLLERRANWCSAPAGGEPPCIAIEALDAKASRALAAQLLQRAGEPQPALLDLIASRAEGNPFYIEELVQMLIERGAIAAGEGGPALRAETLLATQLPQSLTGVVQARLDALPSRERRALRSASVIGTVFWDRALAAVDSRAPAALPALVERRLTLPRPEADFDGVREYGFAHQILQRVTYTTLLRRVRRVLHARAAAWLAALDGVRANDFLAATAEHYALAGDDAQAARYFTRAAEHARARHAHELALAHGESAIARLDAIASASAAHDDEAARLRARVFAVREYTLAVLGRRAEQRDALAAWGELADRMNDDALRAMVARRRSLYAMRLADTGAQEAAAREAIGFATRAGDAESRLEAQRLLADALGAQGRLDEGAELAQQGLAEARALGLRRVEGVFLNALSFIANLRDDQVAGLAYDLQDLAIWRDLGDRHGEAVALGNLGADWLWFGQLEQAGRCLEDTLRLCRAIGARSLQCASLGNLSQARLYAGDAQAALALGREGVTLAAEVLAADFEAAAWLRVGDAELALGDPVAAAEAYARGEAVARGIDHPLQIDAAAGGLRAALAAGDSDAALRAAEPLYALAAEPGALDGADARLVLLSCHRAFARAGDARARAALDAAHAALQRAAATISDESLRTSFMRRVPQHREIAAAWDALAVQPGAPPAT